MSAASSRTRCWMASALISSRPSFNSVRRMASSTLLGRRDQKDPDIPAHVTDDHRGHPLFARVEGPPEEAGGSRGPGESEIRREQVNAAIDGGGEQGTAAPAKAPHQAALDETAPEELLARSDHQREDGGDGLGWRGSSQLVDPGNLSVAGGHDSAGHPVAHLEDRVEPGGRSKPFEDVPEPRALASQGRFDRQGVGAQTADPECHPQPELGAWPAEGRGPDGRGQAEARDDPLQRTADPATSPTRSRAPKAPCRRAVMRSIMAIARRWPSAPRSASRKIQATSGRLKSVRRASVGSAAPITSARRKPDQATTKASRSVIFPLRIAIDIRGEVMASIPWRTS